MIPSHLLPGHQNVSAKDSNMFGSPHVDDTSCLDIALHKESDPFWGAKEIGEKGVTLSCGTSSTGRSCLLTSWE